MAIIYSFTRSFDKYWPDTLSLSGTPLDAGGIMMNKIVHNPGLRVFTAWRGDLYPVTLKAQKPFPEPRSETMSQLGFFVG